MKYLIIAMLLNLSACASTWEKMEQNRQDKIARRANSQTTNCQPKWPSGYTCVTRNN